MAVQSAARAAYGRGEIAEEQVRWADAAAHFASAARLAPDYDRLNKAQQFHWRAGQNNEAARWAEELIDLAKTEIGKDQPQTATALNHLGTIYKDMARYDEAEPLYRQAVDILRTKLGPDHPTTKTVVANYAALLAQRDGSASD